MSSTDEENLALYQEQLRTVEAALINSTDESEKQELSILRDNIQELISLIASDENASDVPSTSLPTSRNTCIDDEYAQFMKELQNEKVPEPNDLVGKKCQAPFKHRWGVVEYSNAMISSVTKDGNEEELMVQVLFTNPTQKEMLPCPFFLGSECKFSAEKCRFSHGESVPYSSLKEYIEPQFDLLEIGSQVLVKKSDNIWDKGVVRRILDEKYVVRLQSNKNEVEAELEHIFPLSDKEGSESDSESDYEEQIEDVRPLLQPQDTFAEWEKYTKGMGSKMMQNMGYIFGMGLGPKANGRVDPVPAFILPSGKSLDYCMNLREKSGGDKNLFSVEKKLKIIQKKQEMRNKQVYENEKNKVDVFNILNQTLGKPKKAEDIYLYKSKHRKEVKGETERGLNVAELKNTENIRRVEKDVEKIKMSLSRHKEVTSHMNKVLRGQLIEKQNELRKLQVQSANISNEQKLRSDNKKMTIF